MELVPLLSGNFRKVSLVKTVILDLFRFLYRFDIMIFKEMMQQETGLKCYSGFFTLIPAPTDYKPNSKGFHNQDLPGISVYEISH